jgi:nitroimidazol reductase NimA-like FMN-containing flavoprotein (pyridoxamine 5'-phosphate oxidase superfamily)
MQGEYHMRLDSETIRGILEKNKLLSLATANGACPDNSVVCFAYDDNLHLYFGAYSDTLKCRNIAASPHVAATVGTLQVHGKARVVAYGSAEYAGKREIYDKRFPQYKEVFEREGNELYEIAPLVIWNYNTKRGEMNRDELVFDEEYYRSISPYKFHPYLKRRNE